MTEKRSTALFSAVAGSIFALWLIYAAGLKYLLLADIILALGIPVFIWGRKQNHPDEPSFTHREKWLAVLLVIIALWAIYAFAHGIIKI